MYKVYLLLLIYYYIIFGSKELYDQRTSMSVDFSDECKVTHIYYLYIFTNVRGS